MGLWYPKDSGFELIAYSDADHAGCKDDCKSTSGGLQFLGGKLVSWSSKKQDYIAMSTVEAEYVSLSACFIIMALTTKHAADRSSRCTMSSKPADMDLMDANKKVELEHIQHLYLDVYGKLWHTLRRRYSKHDSSSSCSFLEPWQTLCKIFSKCLTTRVTGWDQPPLQIMQMLYCFVNNIHVDYAELMWEDIYYLLHHPVITSLKYVISLRSVKIVLSLNKFLAIIFNDDDIEEQTSSSFQTEKLIFSAPTISFPGVEKHRMFSIIYEPVHGIIYKNSKKEKRVMRHSEIHKFCDATLNRVLTGLKSCNNDVKYNMYKENSPMMKLSL
ncbi:hypothetical protein Tco_1417719 [Tanacetum coccineum]